MPANRPDPILQHARREAAVVLAIFVAAMIYTVSVCYALGYRRPPEEIRLVFGFPDWVFWGILLPWSVCTLISGWFAFGFMHDDDLGAELADSALADGTAPCEATDE